MCRQRLEWYGLFCYGRGQDVVWEGLEVYREIVGCYISLASKNRSLEQHLNPFCTFVCLEKSRLGRIPNGLWCCFRDLLWQKEVNKELKYYSSNRLGVFVLEEDKFSIFYSFLSATIRLIAFGNLKRCPIFLSLFWQQIWEQWMSYCTLWTQKKVKLRAP